jgi:hypothetical protein
VSLCKDVSLCKEPRTQIQGWSKSARAAGPCSSRAQSAPEEPTPSRLEPHPQRADIPKAEKFLRCPLVEITMWARTEIDVGSRVRSIDGRRVDSATTNGLSMT